MFKNSLKFSTLYVHSGYMFFRVMRVCSFHELDFLCHNIHASNIVRIPNNRYTYMQMQVWALFSTSFGQSYCLQIFRRTSMASTSPAKRLYHFLICHYTSINHIHVSVVVTRITNYIEYGVQKLYHNLNNFRTHSQDFQNILIILN